VSILSNLVEHLSRPFAGRDSGAVMAVREAPPILLESTIVPSTAYAGLGLATIGWASAFIFSKVVLAEMTPLPVAAFRYVVAAAVLLPFALRRRPGGGFRRSAAALGVMIVCGGVLYPWLFLQALAETSATNTAILIALNPVFTVLLSPLAGERLTSRSFAGVMLALAGAVIVITKGDLRLLANLSASHGDLLAVCAAGLWATFTIASRGVVTQLQPAFINCLIYGSGGIVLSLLAFEDGPWTQITLATPAALGALLAMAVLSSVLAGQLFLTGVRAVGVNRASVFVYLVPVLTAILAMLTLGERFEAAQGWGGVSVLAGVYVTTRSRVAS
jgi:drug/metabolite transporter (DMT)-like permease